MIDGLTRELIECGRDFHRRGWSLGTSSNYSAVIDREPLTLLMTGSGFDKGRLQPDQFVIVDENAQSLDEAFPKPSAEALLRSAIAAAIATRRATPEQTRQVRDHLATLLQETGRIDEAVTIRRRLAEEAAASFGETHGEARAAATQYALTLAAQATGRGNHAEAARLYKIILDAYSASLGADHPRTADVRDRWNESQAAASNASRGP